MAVGNKIRALVDFKSCLYSGYIVFSLFFNAQGQAFAEKLQVDDPLHYSSRPVVTYCMDPDWLPYEAIRNHQHVGMSADYMRIIGQIAEVDFQLIRTQNWQETLSFLEKGLCDVASMLNRSPDREQYLLFTEPYFSGENVFVSHEDQPLIDNYASIDQQKVGAVRNYRTTEYIRDHHPNISLSLMQSESEGLQMLAEGKIDVLVGSLLSISANIQKNGLRNLQISGQALPLDQLAMGVTKQNYALLEKLNNAINSLPKQVHMNVYKEWTNVRVVDEIDYRPITAVSLFFMLLVWLGMWRHHIVGRFNKQLVVKNRLLNDLQKELLEKNQSLEFLSMRDPLTSMFNRNYIIERCEQQRKLCLRTKQAVSLIVLDIDYFKKINDLHGHTAGDLVLQEIALRVEKTIRDMDISSRWGGEEFLILCPMSDLQQTKKLAERLNQAIAAEDFADMGHISCSCGVAQYQQDESFIQWFDRADKALYQAKSAGRNQVVLAK